MKKERLLVAFFLFVSITCLVSTLVSAMDTRTADNDLMNIQTDITAGIGWDTSVVQDPLVASENYSEHLEDAGNGSLGDAPGIQMNQVGAGVAPPRGKILFFSNYVGNYKIYSIRADGTGLTQLTSTTAADTLARYSPDKKSIVFIRDSNQVWIMNTDGSNQRYVCDGQSADFASDSKKIVFSDKDGNIKVYDLVKKTANTLVESNRYSGWYILPDWSQIGNDIIFENTFVYSLPHVVNIRHINATNPTVMKSLTDFSDVNEGYARAPRWSPAKNKIAFECLRIEYFWGTYRACDGNGSSGGYEIYTMNADGTNKKRMTFNSYNFKPVWSPDGNYLIFQRISQASVSDMYMVNTDGSNYHKFFSLGAWSLPTDWMDDLPPDVSITTLGNAIAFESVARKGTFVVSRAGDISKPLTVHYSVSGTAKSGIDYVALPAQITINAGQSSKNIYVAAINDTAVEDDETAIVTLLTDPSYQIGSSNTATITIVDNDTTISIAPDDSNVGEQNINGGSFKVTRHGSTSSDLIVTYSISGTASNGVDYTKLAGRVKILAGKSDAPIRVTPIDDTIKEGPETMTLTIQPNLRYTVGSPGSATLTIADND